VYGLGAASLTCRTTITRALPAVLTALSGAVTSVASKKEPAVIDNAVTALAKVIYHVYDGAGQEGQPASSAAAIPVDHLRSIGAPLRRDLMNVFLSRLPLQNDEEEARVSLQVRNHRIPISVVLLTSTAQGFILIEWPRAAVVYVD
jgi:hypothetical protein